MQSGAIPRSSPVIAKNEKTGSLNVLRQAAAVGLAGLRYNVAADGLLTPVDVAANAHGDKTVKLLETSLVHPKGTDFYLPKKEEYPTLAQTTACWSQPTAVGLAAGAPPFTPAAPNRVVLKATAPQAAASKLVLMEPAAPKPLTYAGAAAKGLAYASAAAASPARCATPAKPRAAGPAPALGLDREVAKGYLGALLKHDAINALRFHPNTHGEIRVPSHPNGKRRMTVWEHSLAVALGQRGGMGLGTELLRKKYDQIDTVKTLVLAAGLHDAGKVQKKKRAHIAASAAIAQGILENSTFINVNAQEAAIIPILISHNDVFGRYLQNKIRSAETMQKTLVQAHEKMLQAKIAISMKDCTRLLFHLFVADATTLVALQPLETQFKRARLQLAEAKDPQTLTWIAELSRAEGKRPD